jgi:hypothetical protein
MPRSGLEKPPLRKALVGGHGGGILGVDIHGSAESNDQMRVHGFLPSTYALHFPNDFSPAPIFRFRRRRGLL